MSDFLGNLAATALQVAPITQPRAPTLFEPPAPSNDGPLIEASDMSHVDTSPLRQPLQSSTETHRTGRENVTRHTSVSRSHTHVLESGSRREASTTRSELQPSTIAVPVERATWPVSVIEPSGREEQSDRAAAANAVVTETSSLVSTAPITERASTREISQPKIEHDMRAAQMEREISEPRIHVSIGRIEVRAATAPAPTRTARREASILNLDDYLRQRR